MGASAASMVVIKSAVAVQYLIPYVIIPLSVNCAQINSALGLDLCMDVTLFKFCSFHFLWAFLRFFLRIFLALFCFASVRIIIIFTLVDAPIVAVNVGRKCTCACATINSMRKRRAFIEIHN